MKEEEMIMTEPKVRAILEDIVSLLLKKNQDYGNASFDLGLNGNMVHLWDKIKRFRTLVDKSQYSEQKPNFESIEDTLRDIIGYGIIGLIIASHDKSIK
jgi:ppGpp synthetase/RelA/SpoT-type nucleotidyltranferase